METDICPYKVLNVQRRCSIDSLKKQYKRLAKQYHPDKGGNEYLFNLVTASFKKIFNDIKYDNDHHNLKNQHKINSNLPPHSNPLIDSNDDSFQQKFNKHFEKYKSSTPNTEKGYSSFMNEDDVKVSKKNYKLKKYQTPTAVNYSKLEYEELGVTLNDFSGRNMNNKDLSYMDYEFAHTTSKLIDHDIVKARDSFSSLKDIEKKRKTENFEMTDKEKRYYEKQQNLNTMKETKRLANLNEFDKDAEKVFAKINSLNIQ